MDFYDEFNDNTKKFLNKAMDVYFHIMGQHLTIYYVDVEEKARKARPLSEDDKKILSLIIASLTVDDELKDILNNYEELNVDTLFELLRIKEDEIEPLQKDEYDRFYEQHFSAILNDMHSMATGDKFVYEEISPMVIFEFFGSDEVVIEFDILQDLSKIWDLKLDDLGFSYHPSFSEINNITKEQILTIEEIEKRNRESFERFKQAVANFKQKHMPSVVFLSQQEIINKIEQIKKKFIGQEDAVEFLFYNIINNQELAGKDNLMSGERSIIFLDGPTGTGKTAITKDITDSLGIPFISSSATSYSSTGYVGANLTDILRDLYIKAGGDLEKAQRGIVVLDEFDKLAYTPDSSLDMKKEVQQQLLDFMGGGKYFITIERNKRIEFDTSKLTFICLGALTDLREKKVRKVSTLGFSGQLSTEGEKNNDYSITPDDLCDIGIERELVGRFNTYIHTEEYSMEDLLRILKESEISPIKGFRSWINSRGKILEMSDDVYEAIANAAYMLNTGARSLQTIVNSIRTYFMKQVFIGQERIIYLDGEMVERIVGNTINRKGRR